MIRTSAKLNHTRPTAHAMSAVVIRSRIQTTVYVAATAVLFFNHSTHGMNPQQARPDVCQELGRATTHLKIATT